MFKPTILDTVLVSARSPGVEAESRRLMSLTQACVRCGLCQPHCPTYSLDKKESESPRGRITLAAALAENSLDSAFEAAAVAIDHCLGCRRCESVCPAGVKFDELLVATRGIMRRRKPANWRQRLLEWSIARRWPLTLSLACLRAAQRVLPTGWLVHFPIVPAPAPSGGVHTSCVASRGRVALFTGCVAQQLDADVHRAAIKVLNALGWEVWLPAGPLCCGALHRHAGQLIGAQNESQKSLDAMREELIGCSAVLVAASGCFADLQGTLADIDIAVHELLAFIADDVQLSMLKVKESVQPVVVHTPCTQSTSVRRPDAASRILSAIPAQAIHVLPDIGCCGAAGSHSLIHARRAGTLRAPLLDAIEAKSTHMLCSGNIGCRLHIDAGLRARHSSTHSRHPIEVLADHLL